MAQVLAVEPALQVGVVAAVFTFDHLFGGIDRVVVDAGFGQQRQEQVEDFALVLRRSLDDKGGVGVAGKGIPFPAEALHAFLQPSFAAGIDAAEQHMLQQVWQFLVGAGKVVDAHADDQADCHMPAFSAGLEQDLQAVLQHIALDLQAVQGPGAGGAQQQARKQQTTHNNLPGG